MDIEKLRTKFEKKNPPPEGLEFWPGKLNRYVRDGDWARRHGLTSSALICRDYNKLWSDFLLENLPPPTAAPLPNDLPD